MEGEGEDIWNFAIGSNINPRVAIGRRKLSPKEVLVGKAVNWTLAFHQRGVPFLEPVFAAGVPHQGSELHGVLYRLSKRDWIRLLQSEGGGGSKHGYFPAEIEVEVYETSRKIKAYVLSTNAIEEGLLPSKRYMKIIITGAKEAKIEPKYIQYLEAHPHVSPTPLRIIATLVLFSMCFPLNIITILSALIFRQKPITHKCFHYLQLQLYFFYRLFDRVFPSKVSIPKPYLFHDVIEELNAQEGK